ncbi:MAG TPA: hypothetical protein VK790_03870 [Solirubrobacteraceae bacterium]|nr:hypothetical protein [Solirubrobacteraceae bacterium]
MAASSRPQRALSVGGLSGSAVLAMLTLVGSLGVRPYLRSTR